VCERDLMKQSPGRALCLGWIRLSPAGLHTPENKDFWGLVHELVDEILAADHIGSGTPVYNYNFLAVLQATSTIRAQADTRLPVQSAPTQGLHDPDGVGRGSTRMFSHPRRDSAQKKKASSCGESQDERQRGRHIVGRRNLSRRPVHTTRDGCLATFASEVAEAAADRCGPSS